MGTMQNIIDDPKLTEDFIRLGMQESTLRKKLQILLDEPPALHDCILEIKADDGSWHEKCFADWLLCVMRIGGHVARVRYRHRVLC
jgi:hypothetical protein